jgi:ribosomal protein S18 acetylase RimI-like enzyme
LGTICIDLSRSNASDKEFIIRLSKDLFQLYGPYEKTVPRWFESSMVITTTASLDKRPVGFAMLGNFSERYDLKYGSEILAIAVEPEMQGAGIGEILLKNIEREAALSNIKRLFLHTAVENLPARKLFNRNGFRPWEVKMKFYPAGQDAIVMAKEILD